MLCFQQHWHVAASLSAPPTPKAVASRSSPRKAPAKGEVSRAASEDVPLPEAWKAQLPKEQHEWLSRALFRRNKDGRPVLIDSLQLWWHPPAPRPVFHQPPASPAPFFTCPFFLWMPYRIWSFRLLCGQPNCHRAGQRLTSCGLYKTVRRVLDIDGWYFMATEYLECRLCKKKVAGWSRDVLEQLDPAHRAEFPAILTYRLSCDLKVVWLMRQRSLGNSVSVLYNKLREQHSETWMARTLQYLAVCDRFQVPGADVRQVAPPPAMVPVPSPQWLLTVHAEDVRARIGEMKARVTSIFGSVLKMDSTKKVTKKLAGVAARTMAWSTNVGNEYGQVLMSVLTAHEGDGLLPMATGLMRRYREAGIPPPKLLYVNRDCCSSVGKSKAAAMFCEWEELVVRLDVWHLMRRFAVGVTTDSHQLYGLFMAKLSSCIFEWDSADVARLMQAVQAELEGKQGIVGLSEDQLTGRLTAKMLARHCRRRTRGAQETEQLIAQLLAAFRDVKDTMGIPLLDNQRMDAIWDTQRRHLGCIQDPPGFQLYMETGQLTKGGIVLPTYRCARGSTSLESFHLHLNRFIPGTSANAENFQAYLVEGLAQWNEDRAAAAVDHPEQVLRCYGGQLQHSLNQLSQRLLGLKLVEDYTKPGEYTGELIGVEYLYSQQCLELREDIGHDPDAPDGTPDVMESLGDEGFEEGGPEEEHDPTISSLHLMDSSLTQLSSPAVAEVPSAHARLPADPDPSTPCTAAAPAAAADDDNDDNDDGDDVFRGPDGAPGYDHVVRLARYLVGLRDEPCVAESHVAMIVSLWNNLPERDRQRVSYPPRHRERLLQGGFKASHSKTSVCAGKESLKRCLLGQGTRPAQWPHVSRLVEAICLELCSLHPAGRKIAGVKQNRWTVILQDYSRIRRLVLSSPGLMQATSLQLFEINRRMLSVWHNDLVKRREQAVLSMDIPLPTPSLTTPTPLPEPRQKEPEPAEPPSDLRPFTFAAPPDLSGQAVRRRQPQPAPTPQPQPAPAPAPQPQPAPLPSASIPAAPLLVLLMPGLARAAAPPTPPPAPSQADVPGNLPGLKAWSRTTEWRRRKAAEAQATSQGLPVTPHVTHQHYTCTKCGQPRRQQYGHRRFRNKFFCERAEGISFEDWKAQHREPH
ncbi:uncharacterized protein LOC125718410 isoform X2 [Brienomyrus brachyistius]|uniref:uncharacterized protein LOC125718410 isoform X2 n=1 Tax=Brienomyrus brachyistius TaxID=42636 RepID=UPI0020B3F243|nr:uncharacterized protein LOC125718410 isoform X2 [Brienomyrus brachyistius]